MTAVVSGKTAKIYNFPKGGRTSTGGRANASDAVAVKYQQAEVAFATFGDAWYHQAAIAAGDKGGKP